MIQLMIKPPCFPTVHLFKDWRTLAVHSKEIVTPCDDCTAEYQMNMREAGKCHQDKVLSEFLVVPKSIQQHLDYRSRQTAAKSSKETADFVGN